MRARTFIFALLTIAWMLLIFMYSHRPGPDSQKDSYEIGFMTGRVVVEDFEEKPYADQLAFAMKVDHPIRKLAHFTEYFILGVLMFITLDGYRRRTEASPEVVNDRRFRGVSRWLLPWSISTLYAVSDEIHQYFIPGRNCNLLDVIIDSSGACVGVLVCMGIVAIYSKIHG